MRCSLNDAISLQPTGTHWVLRIPGRQPEIGKQANSVGALIDATGTTALTNDTEHPFQRHVGCLTVPRQPKTLLGAPIDASGTTVLTDNTEFGHRQNNTELEPLTVPLRQRVVMAQRTSE